MRREMDTSCRVCGSGYLRLKISTTAAFFPLLCFVAAAFWMICSGTIAEEEKGVVFLQGLNLTVNKLLAFSSPFTYSNQMASVDTPGKLMKNEEGGSIPEKGGDHSMLSAASLITACCSLLVVAAARKWKWINGVILHGRRRRSPSVNQFHLEKKEDEIYTKNRQKKGIAGEEGWVESLRKKRMVIVVVCLGVIASLWLFIYLNNDTGDRRKEAVESMCEARARMLQHQFNVSVNHVHALAILVSTFHHRKHPSAIDQRTFEEYTESTAFERPLTSGVAYALKVLHSEREEFEREQGWTIKKMEKEDQTLVQDCSTDELDPSPLQDEYAPVIFSQQTVSHIISIDMMSGMEDRQNILRARASGKGVLTSPFKLLKSNHLGVVLTFAVYNRHLPPNATPEERIDATIGYLGASFDILSLVEKLLQQLANMQTIMVNVYDTTNTSAPITMYGDEPVDTGLLHVSHLDFGDPTRKHEMHCRFRQKAPPPWTAITLSLGVLVISLLIAQTFNIAVNRITQVEKDYIEMMKLKSRAEAADVAKSQFLATVSHEIRTPMNGVLGMLQMLMDTDLDATQLDFAQTAHDSGKDLISLINEVLDQAKIESGKLDLESVTFDPRAVLDNVLSLFSGRSCARGIELAVFVSDLVPEAIIGDPGRFRQILTNLVGNSIKFTKKKGHVFVSVGLAHEVGKHQEAMSEAWPTLSGFPIVNRSKSWQNFRFMRKMEDEGEVRLLVTVEDTGEGVPHHVQGQIFTPFVQADSSTSRTYGGTGIGLSISKRLVDLMCGDIGFVSEPGIGSTFSFTAVFMKGESSSLASRKQPGGVAMVSQLRGLHALVVDGRRTRAEVLRYHLKRLGICVEIVPNLHFNTSDVSIPRKELAMVFVDEEQWKGEACLEIRHMIHNIGPSSNGKMPPKLYILTNSVKPVLNEAKAKSIVDDILVKPLRLSVLLRCFQDSNRVYRRRVSSHPPLGNLLKGKRILVVDDNAVNRRVAEGALRKYGASVVCVESGKEALVKLKPPHDFDACFMDLQMPEMDGFDTTKQIRYMEKKINERIESGEEVTMGDQPGNTREWHVPILAMTADLFQASSGECLKCGMDDYISKPFEEHQLYAAVARFFEPR